MVERVRIAAAAAVLSLAVAGTAGAEPKQEEKAPVPVTPKATDRTDAESKKVYPVPIFVPRETGAPSARVRGATRGPEFEKIPSIDALVPERVGYTLNAQPTLYWYLSDSTDYPVEFKLVALGSQSADPEFKTTWNGPRDAGIHRIDLGSYGITLRPGVTYMWSVTLLPDASSRSNARYSTGAIQLMTAPPALQDALDAASAEERPFVLAAAGIWYDALSVLSESVRSYSDGTRPRAQRAALLEQVGLGAAVVP